MSLRLAKQIIYGFFYLVLWGGLIALAYFLFLKPAPSCFDNVKNQGESGVDCGGPCSKVCIPKEIRPIELVGDVLTFATGQDHISLLAQVKNSNADFAAKRFNYAFSFYDASGKLLRSIQGNSFIYASEVKYILALSEELTATDSINKVNFSVSDVQWDSAYNFRGPPSIAIQDVKTSFQKKNGIYEGEFLAEGRITNNDTVAFPLATVVAIFSGSRGQVVGASQTQIDNLTPNESKLFSIIFPKIQDDINASNTKLFVYASRR